MADHPTFKRRRTPADEVTLRALLARIEASRPDGGDDSGNSLTPSSQPNGPATAFTVDDTADTILSVGHGLVDGDIVVMRVDDPDTDVIPGGLFEDTQLFVVNANLDDFQVSGTDGGTPLDITDTGTGTFTYKNVGFLEGTPFSMRDYSGLLYLVTSTSDPPTALTGAPTTFGLQWLKVDGNPYATERSSTVFNDTSLGLNVGLDILGSELIRGSQYRVRVVNGYDDPVPFTTLPVGITTIVIPARDPITGSFVGPNEPLSSLSYYLLTRNLPHGLGPLNELINQSITLAGAMYQHIASVSPDAARQGPGAEVTNFGAMKVAFQNEFFRLEFADEQDAGRTPATMLVPDGITVSVTQLGASGSATFDLGDMLLSTGTAVDGGIMVEIGPLDYHAADDIEIYFTKQMMQTFASADIEARFGVGSGTLDDAQEDFHGIRIIGNGAATGNGDEDHDIFASHYSGDQGGTGERKDVPQSGWSSERMDGSPGSTHVDGAGNIITYNPLFRQLQHEDYSYLGAIAGRIRTKRPTKGWSDNHDHEHAGVKTGRNFQRPNQYVRFILRKTGGADATDYQVRMASVAAFSVTSPMERGSIRVVQGRRISEIGDRTKVTIRAENLTASQQLYAIPAGKRYVVENIAGAARNSDVNNPGVFKIRDNGLTGDMALPRAIAEAEGGFAGDQVDNFTPQFGDTLFLTDIYYEEVSGIVTTDLVIVGYLEDTP